MGLDHVVDEDAHEAHEGQARPGVARGDERLAARRGEGEEQRHPQGEAREDQRDRGDLEERELGGDEGDPPEDDGEEDAEARRRGC
jgi:hypothetical protein